VAFLWCLVLLLVGLGVCSLLFGFLLFWLGFAFALFVFIVLLYLLLVCLFYDCIYSCSVFLSVIYEFVLRWCVCVGLFSFFLLFGRLLFDFAILV